MNQDRAGFLGFAHVAQHRQQMVEVVAVDRADVVEAHFLEQGAAGQDAAGVFLGAAGGALDAAGKRLAMRPASSRSDRKLRDDISRDR